MPPAQGYRRDNQPLPARRLKTLLQPADVYHAQHIAMPSSKDDHGEVRTYLATLPGELLVNIITAGLDLNDISRFSKVCKRFMEIVLKSANLLLRVRSMLLNPPNTNITCRHWLHIAKKEALAEHLLYDGY
jgi:hypothetical protein